MFTNKRRKGASILEHIVTQEPAVFLQRYLVKVVQFSL